MNQTMNQTTDETIKETMNDTKNEIKNEIMNEIKNEMKNKKIELEYNKPWILQRADPYIYRHEDGVYYFTASVPEYNCIMLRRSDTLFGLQTAEENIIWKKHDKGEMSCHIWAPEIHYLKGKWYLYFAAGDMDDVWKIRPYVLECTGENPIEDEWIECGMMKCALEDEFSFRAFSLDGTIFENKGKHYYVWAEKVSVGKQISNLYIAEMETPTQLKSVQVLLCTPDYDWERVGFWVNEGPAVIKRDGRIYLTYSASETGIHYCMGMISADENSQLLDPLSWKKERHPVLQSSKEHNVYGPGHNSFTADEEGNTICVYHARTEEEIEGNPLYNPNRHTMLMKVDWNADGKPEFQIN